MSNPIIHPDPRTYAARQLRARVALREALAQWRAARDHYRAFSRLLREREADPGAHPDTTAAVERICIAYAKTADARWAECFFAVRLLEDAAGRAPSSPDDYPPPVTPDDWRRVREAAA